MSEAACPQPFGGFPDCIVLPRSEALDVLAAMEETRDALVGRSDPDLLALAVLLADAIPPVRDRLLGY